MPVNNYANIQALIADVLARSDLTSQITDAITLFEAEASEELFRTRGTETRTILVPSSPQALTITGCITDPAGSGQVQVTYTPISTNPTIATGNIVNVYGVNGTSEADGSWVVTVTSTTTFLLQNSVFLNAYISGGNIQQDIGFCALPSNYLGWRRLTYTGIPSIDLEYCSPAVWDEEFPQYQPLVSITAIPQVFTVEAGYIKIAPAANTTPLEFIYWAQTAALSGSFNWLATYRPDAYVMGALEKIYGLWIKDFNQAEAYGRKKTEIFNEIKMQRFREFNNMRIRIDRSSFGATP